MWLDNMKWHATNFPHLAKSPRWLGQCTIESLKWFHVTHFWNWLVNSCFSRDFRATFFLIMLFSSLFAFFYSYFFHFCSVVFSFSIFIFFLLWFFHSFFFVDVFFMFFKLLFIWFFMLSINFFSSSFVLFSFFSSCNSCV